MKYIKLFEQVIDEPKVGDYVKIDARSSKSLNILKEFFDNEIGQIVEINLVELKNSGYAYYVIFEKDIPSSNLGPGINKTMAFSKKELLACANSKDELEIKINANIYNI